MTSSVTLRKCGNRGRPFPAFRVFPPGPLNQLSKSWVYDTVTQHRAFNLKLYSGWDFSCLGK